MGLKEISWEGMDQINLAHDRDKWPSALKTLMSFRVL